MSQAVERKKAEVLRIDTGSPKSLPVEFFNNRTRNSTKLINNNDESNFMHGRNHTYWFDLKNPMYVSHIVVDVEGYSSYKKLEFRWKTQRNASETSERVKLDDDGEFLVVIDDVLTSFAIRPPKQSFSDPKIKGIRVHGATLEQLDKVMEDFGYMDRTKEELREECEKWVNRANEAEATIASLETQKRSLDSDIEILTEQQADAESGAEAAESKMEDVEKQLVARRNEESEATTRIETIDDNIEKKKKESETLNTEIAQQTRKLKHINDEIRLFPTEISGYFRQGRNSLIQYALLALIPVGLLLFFVGVLFSNAIDLTTVYERREGVHLWTMLLSRLPFALISMFVITACYKIAKIFILEYVRISNRRLDLTKVSIVAKDVSDASAQGLELTDGERYELSTRLKMDMLKSHLKGYVAEDYEYNLDATFYEKVKSLFTRK